MTTRSTAPPPPVSARLTLTPRGQRKGPLYPGQTADFDLVLENTDAAPLSVKTLDGNLDTPQVRLFGPQGLIGVFDPRARGARMVGDISTLMQPTPSVTTLAPGARDATWINLWGFHDPLPPGTYSVDAVHHVGPGAASVAAAPASFDIVPARVHAAAFGYDSRGRAQTLLAWLAAPDQAPTLRLLLRESGTAGHASLHQGGTLLGEFPIGTAIAISQYAPDASPTRVNWVAALAPDGAATLFRQASAFVQGAPIQFQTGLRDPKPVARFPNRGNVVLLATGTSPQGPALSGFVVTPAGLQSSWTVPLPALPTLAACAFSKVGPIHVLLVFDQGHEASARLLSLDESAGTHKPPRTVYTTPHAIVALVEARRTPSAFHLLEADRVQHDRMALLRVAADTVKPLPVPELVRFEGWPLSARSESPETAEGRRPLPATAVNLEQAVDDSVWFALTDPQGNLYGGNVASHAVTPLAEAGQAPLSLPHVAALRNGNTYFAFTPDGLMLMTPTLHH